MKKNYYILITAAVAVIFLLGQSGYISSKLLSIYDVVAGYREDVVDLTACEEAMEKFYFSMEQVNLAFTDTDFDQKLEAARFTMLDSISYIRKMEENNPEKDREPHNLAAMQISNIEKMLDLTIPLQNSYADAYNVGIEKLPRLSRVIEVALEQLSERLTFVDDVEVRFSGYYLYKQYAALNKYLYERMTLFSYGSDLDYALETFGKTLKGIDAYFEHNKAGNDPDRQLFAEIARAQEVLSKAFAEYGPILQKVNSDMNMAKKAWDEIHSLGEDTASELESATKAMRNYADGRAIYIRDNFAGMIDDILCVNIAAVAFTIFLALAFILAPRVKHLGCANK